MTVAVVILSTRVSRRGTELVPSRELEFRLRKGAQVFEQTIGPKIIIACGKGRNKQVRSASHVMRTYLNQVLGINDECIYEQFYSEDTIEDALFTRKLIEELNQSGLSFFDPYQGEYIELPAIDKLIIVTSDYHIVRARICFQHFFNSSKITMMPAGTPERINQKRQIKENQILGEKYFNFILEKKKNKNAIIEARTRAYFFFV